MCWNSGALLLAIDYPDLAALVKLDRISIVLVVLDYCCGLKLLKLMRWIELASVDFCFVPDFGVDVLANLQDSLLFVSFEPDLAAASEWNLSDRTARSLGTRTDGR